MNVFMFSILLYLITPDLPHVNNDVLKENINRLFYGFLTQSYVLLIVLDRNRQVYRYFERILMRSKYHMVTLATFENYSHVENGK